MKISIFNTALAIFAASDTIFPVADAINAVAKIVFATAKTISAVMVLIKLLDYFIPEKGKKILYINKTNHPKIIF